MCSLSKLWQPRAATGTSLPDASSVTGSMGNERAMLTRSDRMCSSSQTQPLRADEFGIGGDPIDMTVET